MEMASTPGAMHVTASFAVQSRASGRHLLEMPLHALVYGVSVLTDGSCNEPFGYWQDGAPEDRPTIVSRLVTADYWIRQCGLYFPEGELSSPTPSSASQISES